MKEAPKTGRNPLEIETQVNVLLRIREDDSMIQHLLVFTPFVPGGGSDTFRHSGNRMVLGGGGRSSPGNAGEDVSSFFTGPLGKYTPPSTLRGLNFGAGLHPLSRPSSFLS